MLRKIAVEISEFASGKDFLDSNTDFDIVFLDIELGDLNGIQIAEELRGKKDSIIIIITSYIEYLDDAMDLNVIRFLYKPIEARKVFSAIERALDEINTKIVTFVTKDNKYVRIKISDIVYVEAKMRVSNVCTKKQMYIVKEGINRIKDKLNFSDFYVPHNSYIVNMNFIKSFSREEIIVATEQFNVKIQVSSRKQAEFKRHFLAFIKEGN